MSKEVEAKVVTGTGDGGVSTQSRGARGQRFYAFMLTAIIVNSTLYLATVINAPLEIANTVIYMECISGLFLIAGRTGVHVMEAWAASKLGTSSKTVTSTVVQQTAVPAVPVETK